MKGRYILAVAAALILGVASIHARQGAWEDVQRAPQAPATEHIDVEDVDIAIREGFVYVTVQRPVTVKIFTILGQAVTQQTLSQGTSRFKLPAKGIYILKIGSATRRITI